MAHFSTLSAEEFWTVEGQGVALPLAPYLSYHLDKTDVVYLWEFHQNMKFHKMYLWEFDPKMQNMIVSKCNLLEFDQNMIVS